MSVKVPDECYKEFGADLDGCSTQEREGCGNCRLAKHVSDAPDLITEARELCEKASPETECKFCGAKRHRIMEAFGDGKAKIIDAAGHYALSVEDNHERISLIFNISYCPICGKELKGE